MKGFKKSLLGLMGVLIVVFFCSVVIAADEQTISGVINDNGQLVANDGKIYDLGESDKSMELYDMTGQKVVVTGTVLEDEEIMVIDVIDYKVSE